LRGVLSLFRRRKEKEEPYNSCLGLIKTEDLKKGKGPDSAPTLFCFHREEMKSGGSGILLLCPGEEKKEKKRGGESLPGRGKKIAGGNQKLFLGRRACFNEGEGESHHRPRSEKGVFRRKEKGREGSIPDRRR